MPKYRITGPGGDTFEITAPEGASEAQVLTFARQQLQSQPAPAPSLPKVGAPSGGIGMGLRDPVDALAQVARRVVPEPVAKAVDAAGNWMADQGLPVARSNGVEGVDNIVKGVNATYEAGRRAREPQTPSGLVTGERPEPGFDWTRLLGNMLNPVNYLGGGAVKGASTVRQLATAGAKAGAASGAMQPVLDTENFWTEKGKQAGMGAVAGAIATPIMSKGAEKVAQGVQALSTKARPAPTPSQINVAVNNTFANQGMNAADMPPVILDSVRRQIDEGMRAGVKLDPAAILRKAQFEAVRMTDEAAPTLGQLTRDPMQFANEKNLSGVRIKTPQGEGNPLADRFNVQQQRLGEVFDRVGARDATDRVTAGQTITDALRSADAPVKAAVDGAYQNARSMTGGRAARVDSAAFSQTANDALDRGMWGHFVPPEIRSLLNDVTAGKTPLTVETSVQMDSILSAAQRRAGQGSPQASAIGVIRDALRAAPLAKDAPAAVTPAVDAAAQAARTVDEGVTDVAARMPPPAALPGQRALPAPPGTAVAESTMSPIGGALSTDVIPPVAPVMDEGAAAREAFDQARKAARNRFATIEDTPALAAALDGQAPDKFVQNFVLGANVRDVEAMRRVLSNSPEALSQARAQVAQHLKNAAFGPNPSGDKAFAADRYMRTLDALGRQKLGVFFTPSELVQLNLAGKVASDINSIPAGAKYGTNTSGTGAAVMNLLSKIAESGPLRQIPGMRMLANQVGEIKTERAINQALQPAAEKQVSEAAPEVVRALKLPLPSGSVASGVLGGSSVNQPMDGSPDQRSQGGGKDDAQGVVVHPASVPPKDPLSMLPKGTKRIGTANGIPVYQAPNGKRYLVE